MAPDSLAETKKALISGRTGLGFGLHAARRCGGTRMAIDLLVIGVRLAVYFIQTLVFGRRFRHNRNLSGFTIGRNGWMKADWEPSAAKSNHRPRPLEAPGFIDVTYRDI